MNLFKETRNLLRGSHFEAYFFFVLVVTFRGHPSEQSTFDIPCSIFGILSVFCSLSSVLLSLEARNLAVFQRKVQPSFGNGHTVEHRRTFQLILSRLFTVAG